MSRTANVLAAALVATGIAAVAVPPAAAAPTSPATDCRAAGGEYTRDRLAHRCSTTATSTTVTEVSQHSALEEVAPDRSEKYIATFRYHATSTATTVVTTKGRRTTTATTRSAPNGSLTDERCVRTAYVLSTASLQAAEPVALEECAARELFTWPLPGPTGP